MRETVCFMSFPSSAFSISFFSIYVYAQLDSDHLLMTYEFSECMLHQLEELMVSEKERRSAQTSTKESKAYNIPRKPSRAELSRCRCRAEPSQGDRASIPLIEIITIIQ